MSDNFHEEEKLGKVYDSRLMRRLLAYTRPHRWLILISLVVVMLITASELAGPYLIKVAIDDHINALQTPMTGVPEMEWKEQDVKGIEYKDYVFVRQSETSTQHSLWKQWLGIDSPPPSDAFLASGETYQVVTIDEVSYLIQGAIDTKFDNYSYIPSNGSSVPVPNIPPSPLLEQKTGVVQTQEGEVYWAQPLTNEELLLFREADISALITLGAVYLVLVLLAFFLGYAQTYSLHYVAQNIIRKLRNEIFSHLQRLSFSFFDRNPVGRLVTRVTNDTETLNEMYSNVLVNMFKDLFVLAGIMFIMLQLDVELALLAFTTLPLIIGTTVLYKRYARDAFREVRTRLARINASMNENITGMRIVHIFKREKQQYDQFESINKGHYDAGIKELQLNSLFRPAMDFIYAMGLALLLWYGSGKVISGAVQFGVLYAFIDYINRFFKPINDMTEKFTIMQQAMTSSERIFELLDETDTLTEPKQPKELKQVHGAIEFKDVSFSYNENEWVLHDINFQVKPGETVAFVGATGAGKSSIISLLTRFYDVQKGSITIDGIDIRDVSKSDLRKKIGVVLQDVFLFAGDIESNIRLNQKNISDAKIKEVADYVNASSFIDKLPDGFKEEVKERGATLSAGQRQLLAFARTLAFDPSILVLDEATANIDTETELLIQDALKKVSKDRTTLIIAHRLSTIQHADKIIVMHKGRIREMGTHQQLLKKEGLYYHLYELQYKDQLESKENTSDLQTSRSTGTNG
jgi:ATP-binding cassette subfamily B multidrug efflux pump